MTATLMMVCVGDGETAEQLVEDVGCGAGRTRCPECGGDGDWTKFFPGPVTDGLIICTDCKGTGWQMVSI